MTGFEPEDTSGDDSFKEDLDDTFDRETRCMVWKQDLRFPSKRVHPASTFDLNVPRAAVQYTLTTMETRE